MGDGAARAIPVPRLNLPPNINEIFEQLPIDWKILYVELIGSAKRMHNKIKEILNTLDSITDLENLVNATTPPDTTTLAGVVEKCKNLKEGLKNAVNDFLCNGPSCEENFDKIWKARKNDVLKQLKDEKMEAVINCLQGQAILRAVIIIVEIQSLLSIWRDIENAENIIKTSKEDDIPEIEERIKNLKKDEQNLTKLIETNLRGGNQQLMGEMRTITDRLVLYINAARNMINAVKRQNIIISVK